MVCNIMLGRNIYLLIFNLLFFMQKDVLEYLPSFTCFVCNSFILLKLKMNSISVWNHYLNIFSHQGLSILLFVNLLRNP